MSVRLIRQGSTESRIVTGSNTSANHVTWVVDNTST